MLPTVILYIYMYVCVCVYIYVIIAKKYTFLSLGKVYISNTDTIGL